jgi:hypothetical protein
VTAADRQRKSAARRDGCASLGGNYCCGGSRHGIGIFKHFKFHADFFPEPSGKHVILSADFMILRLTTVHENARSALEFGGLTPP